MCVGIDARQFRGGEIGAFVRRSAGRGSPADFPRSSRRVRRGRTRLTIFLILSAAEFIPIPASWMALMAGLQADSTAYGLRARSPDGARQLHGLSRITLRSIRATRLSLAANQVSDFTQQEIADS